MPSKKVSEKENDIDSKPSKNVRKSAADVIMKYADFLVDLSDTISKEADIILEPVIGSVEPVENMQENGSGDFPKLFETLYTKFEIIEKNLKAIQKTINATELNY
jgi:hypothetical protein